MFKNRRNMSVIAYANGWTLWCYKDMQTPIEEMVHKGFFDTVKDLMAVGDVIYIVGSNGVKHMYVYALDTVAVKEIC